MNSNVSYGVQLIVIYQYWFIDYKECTTQMQDLTNRGNWTGAQWGAGVEQRKLWLRESTWRHRVLLWDRFWVLSRKLARRRLEDSGRADIGVLSPTLISIKSLAPQTFLIFFLHLSVLMSMHLPPSSHIWLWHLLFKIVLSLVSCLIDSGIRNFALSFSMTLEQHLQYSPYLSLLESLQIKP